MHGRVRFKVGDLVRENIDGNVSEAGIIIKLSDAGWVVRFPSHGDFWMSPQNLELVNAAR
mgnify:CR=1 FL=1